MYNLSNLEAQFKNFLVSGNISRVSIRNYLSDMRHLQGWAISKKGINEVRLLMNEAVLEEYKEYLIDSQLPYKTINRRLSSLRKICSFLRFEGIIENFPEYGLKNLPFKLETEKIILSSYKTDLEEKCDDKEKVAQHMADIIDLVNFI